ncbi:MAG: glycosyltransferase [Acidobacteria bacterium]|nr:glycosyltransferase [Acidobacteriota bacterium]MBV9478958.1 glycosyltransferase [Acidobacteriota bacterium]
MDTPLVSWIVATRNRRAFFLRTLDCFARQTYPHRELVVADGSDEPVEDLCAGREGVRYLRVDPDTPLGTCLNRAAETSRGAFMQKIDDDDYYLPAFMQRGVDALRASDADDTIVAWDCFLVRVGDDEALRFSGHGWAAGGTLTFTRELWERTRFRDTREHEDHKFIEDSHARVRTLCAPELYVLVRHDANHWNDLRGTDVNAYFRSLPASGQRASEVFA